MKLGKVDINLKEEFELEDSLDKLFEEKRRKLNENKESKKEPTMSSVSDDFGDIPEDLYESFEQKIRNSKKVD